MTARPRRPHPPAAPRPAAFDPDAAAVPGSGIFGLPHSPEQARVVLIPVPWEATVSYGGGTSKGPDAIRAASVQVDLFDREYGAVHEAGIAMLRVPAEIKRLAAQARKDAMPVLRAGGVTPGDRRLAAAAAKVNAASDELNDWVRGEARAWLAEGKLVGVVGGDHSSPYGLIAELADRHPGLGILHVDAHADLREAYEGFTWSHASIHHNTMTRLRGVARLVQVGVRDFGSREMALSDASRGRIRTHYESDVRRELLSGVTWDAFCKRAVSDLPRRVHVSFDIDGLSPELCPHTGTPVPGGLSFAEACHLLRTLAESGREVVGFDLCEVAPGPSGDWDANVGARVLYKLAGCALRSAPARR